jgi:hypothetical protein
MAYRVYTWRQRNPEKRTLQRRIYKTRSRLRELGTLPPVGVDMSEEQKTIYEQLGRGDFSYWDTVKTKGGVGIKFHDGGSRVNSQKLTYKSPEELLWERSKQNAKERKLIFDITNEDIVIPEICPIANISISVDFEDRNSNNYYVLDRIDWSMGIVKGNVRVVSNLGLTHKIKELGLSGYFDNVDYVPEDIRKEICIKAKRNARSGKYEFNLTPEDIEVPEYCPFLKTKLSFNKKDCREPFYYSIDRIDSSKGYIKGNVQIISKLANTMKNNSTSDELLVFAKGVLEMYKNS